MGQTGTGQATTPEWDAERVSLGRHFIRDMEGLWAGVLRLAAVVEETLATSVRALCDGRPDLADEVKGQEREIDRWEVQIERDCLRVLALHQPVASDLRRVTAVLKVNGDLERMADLAMHIAKRVKKDARDAQGSGTPASMPLGLEPLATDALAQVRDAFDSLARSDSALARSVIAGDRRIDKLRGAVQDELKEAIRRDPDRLDSCLRLINSTRNLERIADHATNIAEAVVYLKEGDIIRHDQATGRWVRASLSSE